MAVAVLIPAAEAAAFTLGCALIHAQQRHAERLTSILMLVAVVVLLGIIFVATLAEVLNAAAMAETMAELDTMLPEQP